MLIAFVNFGGEYIGVLNYFLYFNNSPKKGKSWLFNYII